MASKKIIKSTEISIQMSFNGTIYMFTLRDRLILLCGVFVVHGKTKACEVQFEDLDFRDVQLRNLNRTKKSEIFNGL